MSIRIYNTLTRQKEEFIPKHTRHIGIYVCGVTPYSETHLGHARPSVVWDVMKRHLKRLHHQILHVQNFTDVDDKIIERAQKQGVDALELSRYYSQDYLESMDALGVERADIYPRVSEEMDSIIAMIQTLVANGLAYAANGSVFYDVAKFPEYGKLSNQKLEELQAGTRFDVDPAKRSPMDFALWKAAKPGEPAWGSPWGEGRPGWHIECSAMADTYLGQEFDFHGGGSDLIFPHHENEIAQTQGATGRTGARFWVHNGMLNLKAEKMSKSTGNFLTIKDVLQKYPKELLRFYILSNHYRSELEYHDEKLDEVARGWGRLNQFVVELRQTVGIRLPLPVPLEGEQEQLRQAVVDQRKRFEAAMDDDFNTALAIARLFDLMKIVRNYQSGNAEGSAHDYALSLALQAFTELGDDVLGIFQWQQDAGDQLEPVMEMVLELRQTLRQERNFALADTVRDGLSRAGIAVEDTPQGARWKVG